MACELYQSDRGWIELRVEGQGWVRLYISHQQVLSSLTPEPPYRLSRYASLVTSQYEFWNLISPLAVGRLWIRDVRVMTLLYSLANIPPEFDADTVTMFITLLGQAGFLDHLDSAYAAWPVEELMHVVNLPIDLRGPQPPIDPLKPAMSEDIVALPDVPPQSWHDESFIRVIQARRTIYRYDETPVTVAHLSEFLSRTLRVHGEVKGRFYDTTRRWYPSAGAAYELEAYLAVEQCVGLDAGFYHYHPDRHTLERLPLDALIQHQWGEDVNVSTGYQMREKPQILFFFTARIGRLHNKHRGIALAYTNLGIVFQSFYLTATAMNLAPCALGGWDAKYFARQTGIPLAEEALVGQFLLGSQSSKVSNIS